jgi:hypothetical protein
LYIQQRTWKRKSVPSTRGEVNVIKI